MTNILAASQNELIHRKKIKGLSRPETMVQSLTMVSFTTVSQFHWTHLTKPYALNINSQNVDFWGVPKTFSEVPLGKIYFHNNTKIYVPTPFSLCSDLHWWYKSNGDENYWNLSINEGWVYVPVAIVFFTTMHLQENKKASFS